MARSRLNVTMENVPIRTPTYCQNENHSHTLTLSLCIFHTRPAR